MPNMLKPNSVLNGRCNDLLSLFVDIHFEATNRINFLPYFVDNDCCGIEVIGGFARLVLISPSSSSLEDILMAFVEPEP
jgi:hypothetical protein